MSDLRMPTLPLISVNRHRLGIDGTGVTTLVGSAGCPLGCLYCLNPEARDSLKVTALITPQELLKQVEEDHLYYLATGGGITFGGGESLLHVDFIKAFRAICPPGWRITVETSLNVPGQILKEALDSVDQYIVDIKDMNPVIYQKYTGQDNSNVLSNLELLIRKVQFEHIKIRVPLIPSFNTQEDREKSNQKLKEMGFTNIENFTYVVR